MATIDKNFRVKQGIVVEKGEIILNGAESGETKLKSTDIAQGTITFPAATGTVALTSDIPTTEDIQDVIGSMVSDNTESGISVSYDDTNGKLNFDVNDFTITLTGDVSGIGTVNNLGNVEFTTSIQPDSVALGTDTTGNYVATISAGDGVSVTGSGSETAAVTVTNTDKGSSQNIFKNVAVSGQSDIVADSNNDTLTFDAGTGITLTTNATTDTLTVTNSGVTSISGTAGEIEVSGSTGSITIGLPDDVEIDGNLVVQGDLTVNGTTTTLNTETLAVEDNTILLNKNVTGTPSTNAGIEVERGTSPNSSLYWDETADRWYVNDGVTDTAIALVGENTFNNFANFTDGTKTATPDSTTDTFTFAAGNGISVAIDDTNDKLTIDNTGILSVTGTANQISASTTSGAVTLSTPQDIHSGATPTFVGVNVGSVTLTDGLVGTATASLTDTSATVVDSWSATTYTSAKYLVQMKNGLDVEILEMLVTIDGNNNVYVTEYADIQTNTQLGTTNADYSGGNVRLLVTATDGTIVKVHKTLIEA